MKNKDVNPYKNNTLSKRYQVTKFYSGIHSNNILDKIGFKEVENKPQTFGVATIYTASK